jgi:hypothetical protein
MSGFISTRIAGTVTPALTWERERFAVTSLLAS